MKLTTPPSLQLFPKSLTPWVNILCDCGMPVTRPGATIHLATHHCPCRHSTPSDTLPSWHTPPKSPPLWSKHARFVPRLEGPGACVFSTRRASLGQTCVGERGLPGELAPPVADGPVCWAWRLTVAGWLCVSCAQAFRMGKTRDISWRKTQVGRGRCCVPFPACERPHPAQR